MIISLIKYCHWNYNKANVEIGVTELEISVGKIFISMVGEPYIAMIFNKLNFPK